MAESRTTLQALMLKAGRVPAKWGWDPNCSELVVSLLVCHSSGQSSPRVSKHTGMNPQASG